MVYWPKQHFLAPDERGPVCGMNNGVANLTRKTSRVNCVRCIKWLTKGAVKL